MRCHCRGKRTGYHSRSSRTQWRWFWAQKVLSTASTTARRRSASPPSWWSPLLSARWKVESCAGRRRTWTLRRTRTCSWSSASHRRTSPTGAPKRRKKRRQSFSATSRTRPSSTFSPMRSEMTLLLYHLKVHLPEATRPLLNPCCYPGEPPHSTGVFKTSTGNRSLDTMDLQMFIE